MAVNTASFLDLAIDGTGLDSGLCLRGRPMEYRGMLLLVAKRKRTREIQRCPAEAISFPTECCTPKVGSQSLSLLFVLSEKGLFGVSGLRSFSRSLATCAQRACWASSLQLQLSCVIPAELEKLGEGSTGWGAGGGQD